MDGPGEIARQGVSSVCKSRECETYGSPESSGGETCGQAGDTGRSVIVGFGSGYIQTGYFLSGRK